MKRSILLLVVVAVVVVGISGCGLWGGGEKPAPDAAPDETADTAPAAPDGTTATTTDPNAATATDPNATAQTASPQMPVYRVAPGNIVVGHAYTYRVRPEGEGWAVIKSALCNIGEGRSAKVSRDQYQECLVPTREIALQICDLQATWKSRQIEEPTNDEAYAEFELTTGEWCYVDDADGKIWVAEKSDTGQHHNRWLFASAAPGQAGKIFARLKAELRLRHDELVARRKAELVRLEAVGVAPAAP